MAETKPKRRRFLVTCLIVLLILLVLSCILFLCALSVSLLGQGADKINNFDLSKLICNPFTNFISSFVQAFK